MFSISEHDARDSLISAASAVDGTQAFPDQERKSSSATSALQGQHQPLRRQSDKTASASTKTISLYGQQASTKSASATKRLSSTLAESSTTTPMAKKLKLLNPKPTKLVNPKPCIPEKQSFLEQLYDKCLFRMYQEESICYVPDREDDETDTDVVGRLIIIMIVSYLYYCVS